MVVRGDAAPANSVRRFFSIAAARLRVIGFAREDLAITYSQSMTTVV